MEFVQSGDFYIFIYSAVNKLVKDKMQNLFLIAENYILPFLRSLL